MMSSATRSTPTRWLICRICLKNGNQDLYSIFGDEEQEKMPELGSLQEKIELYGGIKVYPQNNLPNKICNRCLLLLRAACKFRDLCEQSQQQLKQFINPPKELLEDDDNLVTNTEEQDEGDCMILSSSTQDIEYVTDDKPVSMGEYENANDHLEEEDEEEEDHYLYEHINESSQDPPELMADDSSSFPLDDNVQIEYYDISEPKYNPPSPSNDIEDEIDKAARKTVKRKRRRVVAAGIKDEDGTYRCSFCDNVYQEKAKYVLHIKMHKKVKPHECEICCKRFSTTPQLSRHMNSHTGNRPYKCKYCDACFGDPSTKIKHERIHTNERPYKCDLCPKSFSYSNVLKVHMMVHTGEKPHGCAYCSKTFSQLHHKNAHEKRHRNVIILGSDDNELDIEEDLKEFELEKN